VVVMVVSALTRPLAATAAGEDHAGAGAGAQGAVEEGSAQPGGPAALLALRTTRRVTVAVTV